MKDLIKFSSQKTLLVTLLLTSALVLLITFFNPIESSKVKRDETRLKDLQSLKMAINKLSATASSALCNDKVSKYCSGKSTDAKNQTWVKVNSLNFKLPNDPLNSPVFHYTYCSDSKNWEISAKLESYKYKNKMVSDFGNENQISNNPVTGKYEIGTNLDLIGPSGGCTY